MNYGPRFSSGAASTKMSSNWAKDLHVKRPSWLGNVSQLKLEIGAAKRATKRKIKNGETAMPSTPFDPPHIKTQKEIKEEAEDNMRTRIIKAQQILAFGLTELMEAGINSTKVNNQAIILAMCALSKAVYPWLPEPSFNVSRKPGRHNKCTNCGAPTGSTLCIRCLEERET